MTRDRKMIKKHFLRHKILLGILLIVIVVGIAISSINPYLYGEVIDNITQKDLAGLKRNLVLFFSISLAVQIITILETSLGRVVSIHIENGLKKELYVMVLTMKCQGQDKYMGGELLNGLEFEVAAIIDYYIDLITGSLMIVFNFVISLFFLIRLSGKLTVIALFLLPMSYAVNFFFRKQIKHLQFIQRKFSDKYYGFLNEALSNLKGIKAFQMESGYKQKYDSLLYENFGIMMKSLKLNNRMSFIRSVISNGFNIVILFVSAIIIMGGQMTIGNMVAFNTYLDKLFAAISKVMELNVQKQNIIVSFERIEELLQQGSDEMKGGLVGCEMLKIQKIGFEDVTFQYDVKDILKNFTFCFETSGLFSIVGKNGAGKSTLLRLLEKFYICSKGRITVNDVDLKTLDTNQLRGQISYLAKEPFVVNDTIYNNLKLGNPNSSPEEMAEVCKSVGLHQDIIGFEEGYNTMLGEGGSHLSSGQKQKLGIARILLRNSSLVLLDEATSDLDGEMEKQICRVIKELSKSRIVLNISHRSEIVQQSDKVVVIDDGKVKAVGTAKELELNCVYYQKLFVNI